MKFHETVVTVVTVVQLLYGDCQGVESSRWNELLQRELCQLQVRCQAGFGRRVDDCPAKDAPKSPSAQMCPGSDRAKAVGWLLRDTWPQYAAMCELSVDCHVILPGFLLKIGRSLDQCLITSKKGQKQSWPGCHPGTAYDIPYAASRFGGVASVCWKGLLGEGRPLSAFRFLYGQFRFRAAYEASTFAFGPCRDVQAVTES